MPFKLVLIFIISLMPLLPCAAENVIHMGYRTNEKLPYINKSPDNSGLFAELYGEAALRIGYKLKIVRLPKKRLIKELENGTIDFYPMLAYDKERMAYIHWIPAGYEQRNVALTQSTVNELNSEQSVAGLTQLVGLGNADYLAHFDKSKFEQFSIPELEIERIVKMISSGHGDFYVYEEAPLAYFIYKNQITNMRLHKNLLPKEFRSYAGFSHKSPLYKARINTLFNQDAPISSTNLPVVPEPGSIADQFSNALLQLEKEGFIEALEIKYFGSPLSH